MGLTETGPTEKRQRPRELLKIQKRRAAAFSFCELATRRCVPHAAQRRVSSHPHAAQLKRRPAACFFRFLTRCPGPTSEQTHGSRPKPVRPKAALPAALRPKGCCGLRRAVLRAEGRITGRSTAAHAAAPLTLLRGVSSLGTRRTAACVCPSHTLHSGVSRGHGAYPSKPTFLIASLTTQPIASGAQSLSGGRPFTESMAPSPGR
jgi:hypothetical protein